MAFGISDDLRRLIDRIENAVQGKERLELAYRDEAGAASERIIRPLSVMFWGKVWTVIAWCELRQDFRTFRLDRIATVEADLGVFKVEPGRTLRDFYRLMKERDRISENPPAQPSRLPENR